MPRERRQPQGRSVAANRSRRHQRPLKRQPIERAPSAATAATGCGHVSSTAATIAAASSSVGAGVIVTFVPGTPLTVAFRAMASPATFSAEVWQWDARTSDGWFFVSLPDELADQIDAEFGHRAAGFGSLRVDVTVGTSRWQTSVFPDAKRKTYVLPLKQAVRTKEGLVAGGRATVSLTVIA